jgi:hypothetical protein
MDIIKLAEEFGLPCLKRGEEYIVVGEEHWLVFNNKEGETQCRLIEIC